MAHLIPVSLRCQDEGRGLRCEKGVLIPGGQEQVVVCVEAHFPLHLDVHWVP